MIKNDINLIQRRKSKQYSSKSLALTIGIIVILGVGAFVGILLPSRNLTATKAAVAQLENQLQQYSSIALSAGGTTIDEDIDSNQTLDSIYMAKAKQLNDLNAQLESLKMISTAESNALLFINSLEQSLPSEVNISSLTMSDDKLNIYGSASSDVSLATFCLRLKETNLFENVFVSSSMVSMPGNTTTIFNISATLSESLDSMPEAQMQVGDQADDTTTLEAKDESF